MQPFVCTGFEGDCSDCFLGNGVDGSGWPFYVWFLFVFVLVSARRCCAEMKFVSEWSLSLLDDFLVVGGGIMRDDAGANLQCWFDRVALYPLLGSGRVTEEMPLGPVAAKRCLRGLEGHAVKHRRLRSSCTGVLVART